MNNFSSETDQVLRVSTDTYKKDVPWVELFWNRSPQVYEGFGSLIEKKKKERLIASQKKKTNLTFKERLTLKSCKLM